MKILPYILVLFVFVFGSLNAQIPTKYAAPIKWEKSAYGKEFIMKGIDTLSRDSVLIDRERYIRKNPDGKILEKLISKSTTDIRCLGDGFKLTGDWIGYYESGEIKEIGELLCNYKHGDWLQFYKSGQISKYERYDGLNFIDTDRNASFLNGTYLEYYDNGNIRESGTYKLIEEKVNISIVDPLTYEVSQKCCVWRPKSIKYGEWFQYDTLGILQKVINYDVSVKDSINLRELADRYLEININDLRK